MTVSGHTHQSSDAERIDNMEEEANIFADLRAPFDLSLLDWRVSRSGFKRDGSPWVRVLAYVDSRAIMNRLDEVMGPENWQTKLVDMGDGFACELGLKINGEWVWKTDAAQKTQVEAVKGGASGAVKRAAVQWGIGRYLYDLEETFGQIVDGKGQYTSKVEDKQSRKKEFVHWNPPPLPAFAMPAGAQQPGRGRNMQSEPSPAPEPITEKQINTILWQLGELSATDEQRRNWKLGDVESLTEQQAEKAIPFLQNKIDGLAEQPGEDTESETARKGVDFE